MTIKSDYHKLFQNLNLLIDRTNNEIDIYDKV